MKGDSFSDNGNCERYSSQSLPVHSVLQDMLTHTGLRFQMHE